MNHLYPGFGFGKATRDAFGEMLRDLGREHVDRLRCIEHHDALCWVGRL